MRSGAMTFNEEKGEGMKFSDFHPIVNAVYFAVVIGVTIFSMSPYFLLLSLSGAFIYSLVLKEKGNETKHFYSIYYPCHYDRDKCAVYP